MLHSKDHVIIFIYHAIIFICLNILCNLPQANVPGPPMNLEGHATSSMSITLSWEEPQIINGRISKYIITFMEVRAIAFLINTFSFVNVELLLTTSDLIFLALAG